MTAPIITVWTKPSCVQCTAVKRRLKAAGVPYEEQDLTAPEHESYLAHFKGLGYSSAPITEYGGIAFPGYNPGALDSLIAAYQADSA